MKFKLFIVTILLAAASCGILEGDISGKNVQIIAPTDQARLTAGKVNFRWQALAHASGYEFKVASPSFEYAQRIIADTVFYADSLSRSYGCQLALEEGAYEWSISAFNGGYTSPAKISRLYIETKPISEP